jgi:hypothetical protein
MNAVEECLFGWPEEQRRLGLILRDCLRAPAPELRAPDVTEKVNWKVPFFYHDGWFAYLNPLRRGGVDVCFIRGTQLDDPGGLLERRGRRQIASVPIADLADLEAKASALDELIAQARRLNEIHGKPRLLG